MSPEIDEGMFEDDPNPRRDAQRRFRKLLGETYSLDEPSIPDRSWQDVFHEMDMIVKEYFRNSTLEVRRRLGDDDGWGHSKFRLVVISDQAEYVIGSGETEHEMLQSALGNLAFLDSVQTEDFESIMHDLRVSPLRRMQTVLRNVVRKSGVMTPTGLVMFLALFNLWIQNIGHRLERNEERAEVLDVQQGVIELKRTFEKEHELSPEIEKKFEEIMKELQQATEE